MCEKVTSTNCKDDRIISKTLNEATRMTLKYLDGEECADAAKKLGKFQKVVLQVFSNFIYSIVYCVKLSIMEMSDLNCYIMSISLTYYIT